MTLRGRLAVAAGGGVFLVVATVSVVLYLSYAANLRSRADATLIDAAQQASTLAERLKQTAGESGVAPDLTRLVTVGSTQLQLLPAPLSPGQPTRFGALSQRDVRVAQGDAPAYLSIRTSAGRAYRVYTSPLPSNGDGSLVRSSRALAADDGAKRRAALLLAALTVAAAATAAGLARLSAGRLLRPIGDLTAATEQVARTGDLSRRLGATSHDEVGRLTASFDTMLAALEDAVTARRQLVADASHELRTPLTSLSTNLDLLEDGAGLADPQAPQLVRAAREQARDLDELICDLLDLARYGEEPVHREDVRLDQLVAATVRRLARADVAVQLTGRPCLVSAEPAAVDRAVRNLLANAVAWSPPGAPITVDVSDGTVAITDQGPGISPEDLPHVFERFYRSAAARGRPGAGLGLAIVGSVAAAHGGAVDVRTGPAGSTFRLRLPIAAQPVVGQPVSTGRDGSAPHCDHEPG